MADLPMREHRGDLGGICGRTIGLSSDLGDTSYVSNRGGEI